MPDSTSIAPSRVSLSAETDPLIPPVISVDELPQLSSVPLFETRRQYIKRWTMLSFAYLVQFLMIVQTTIYYSVLWPYLKEIDTEAKESFFGIILGASSFASFISSPLLGWVTNRMHQTRIPLIIGITIAALGNVGTMFCGNFPTGARWALLVFRIITGFGLGSISVVFGYIAMSSTDAERNRAVTIRSAIGSASFLIGPGVASAFSSIGYPGVSLGALQIDMYTAPALFGVLSTIPVLLFLIFLFEDHWVSVDPSQMKTADGNYTEKRLPKYDLLAVCICILVRFTLRFTTSYDQAIGSPLTMTMFGWSGQEAIRYNGIIQSATGGLDFFGNILVYVFVLPYVAYRYLIPLGLISFLLSFIISFAYPSLPPLVESSTVFSDTGNLSLSLDLGLNNSTCDYSWCDYTSKIYLWQYIMFYVFIFAAFSVGYSPTNILYTKLFGPRKQGLSQGIYMASSNLAAATSPILVTALFEAYGPRVAWALGFGLNVVVLTVVLLWNRHLITFDERTSKLRKEYLKI